MPVKGQILINPISNDTYEFIETAADTNGDRVKMKATIHSTGRYVPDHLHLLQEETFEVISGQLTVLQNGTTEIYGPGKKVTLKENTPHNHYNDSKIPVEYIQTVRPALDFDYLVENIIGLAADGRSKNGNFGLVQELVTLKYLDSKSYLADIPIGVQNVLMHIVAPIGRRMGYRAIYKKYSGIEK